ncbi:MAG: hypothetical protein VKJ46_11995 [Leptolyngbyaceae bacterium]|nr:hypothetical protein [Leptolyngbyaceae bacterium]
MSSLVERAMSFYLEHPGIEDVVEAAHGHTHQVYQCPACTSSVVLRDGEMVALEAPSNLLKDTEENLTVKQGHKVGSSTDQPGEELVPC